MVRYYYVDILVALFFIPTYHSSDDCLNRPDTGQRSCTGNKLHLYDNKVEKERKLWTKTSVLSAVRCSILCMDDKSCVSFFYNRDLKTCTGHSIMFGNATAAPLETGSSFYFYSGVEGYIGDLCQTDNDCIVTDSECRVDGDDKRCLCVSGYSFSPTKHTCMINCTVDGDDFLRTYRYFLSLGKAVDYTNVSVDECKQHCIEATNINCRSFTYGDDMSCYMSDLTRFDVAGNKWIKDNLYFLFSYYQRDCL